VLLGDVAKAFGDAVESFLPRGFAELLFAPLADADQRFGEAIAVINQAGAAGAARAEAPAAERMLWVAGDGLEAAVLDVAEDAALPEAHLAEAGDRLGLAWRVVGRPRLCASTFGGTCGGLLRRELGQDRAGGRTEAGDPRDLQEAAAREFAPAATL
jgi:hypothetical protein